MGWEFPFEIYFTSPKLYINLLIYNLALKQVKLSSPSWKYSEYAEMYYSIDKTRMETKILYEVLFGLIIFFHLLQYFIKVVACLPGYAVKFTIPVSKILVYVIFMRSVFSFNISEQLLKSWTLKNTQILACLGSWL